MSVYSDWFIANEEDAAEIYAAEEAFERWPHLQMRGVTEMEISEIHEILLDEECSPAEPLVSEYSEDEGGSVTRVPDPLIAALAFLKEKEIKELVERVKSLESFEDWETSEVSRLLKDMCKFAKRAKKDDIPVLSLSVY